MGIEVEKISRQTTPVWLYKSGDPVSQGTGFFYQQYVGNTKLICLVTNVHVLTGSAPRDNRAPIGDTIKFQVHISAEEPGRVRTIHCPLFTPQGATVWSVHPQHAQADVAVIPLPAKLLETVLDPGGVINVITPEWATTNLKVRPASSVTLVGYPHGYYDRKNALPIWKTGSVASEPGVDFDGNPYFVIDVSAFPGMSGSPVYAIATGFIEQEVGDFTIGSARRFMGIYASMQMLTKPKYLEVLTHDTNQTQLGILDIESLELGHVWKAQLLIDIVASIDIARYEREIMPNLPPIRIT